MRLRTAFLISVALLLAARSATAGIPQTLSQKTVDAVVSRPPLASASVGVFAMRMDGDTLACHNQRVKLVPASNMKLITTGLALASLGEDFRFETRLGYDGTIEDGILKGDLYIIGGGDPTTGSKAQCAEPADALFASWLKLLRAAGIKAVSGRVVGDPRCLGGITPEGLGWTYDDLGTNYGAGPTGLNFFENAQNFSIKPGSSPGQKPDIRVRYPETPWMTFVNHATTGGARTRNTVYYINTHLSPCGEFAGSFPVDRNGYTLECSNRFGAYTCAYYFCRYLTANGVAVEGGASDISPDGHLRATPGIAGDGGPAAEQESLSLIGGTRSAALKSIARETNCESDNFFAETLLKTLSVKRGYGTDYDSCVSAAEAALSSLGLNPASGCRIFDGSGLSRKNYVSPAFFVNFLTAMARTDVAGAFLASLPQPGGKGTLEYKFPSADAAFRSRIRMKSGSMNGILCYSGYILPQDGDLSRAVVFSILTNNTTASSWAVSPQIDKIIEALAAEN